MTTYLEDFNRGSIGTTAPNGATYVNNGGWTIDSNQGLSGANADWKTLVYEHGLTNPAMEVEPVSTDVDDYWGIIVRYTDENNWIVVACDKASNYLSCFRRESGFDFTIQNFLVGVPGPYPIKVEVNGNDFLCYANGVYVGTVTSSFIPSATYAGIGAFGESRFDNFSIYTVDVPPEEPAAASVDGGWGFIPIV